MIEQNPVPTDSASKESHPRAERGNIPDRLQTLREKASDLSKTLDGIEATFQEAAGETKQR